MSCSPQPASGSTVSLCYYSSTSMLDHSRLYYSYREKCGRQCSYRRYGIFVQYLQFVLKHFSPITFNTWSQTAGLHSHLSLTNSFKQVLLQLNITSNTWSCFFKWQFHFISFVLKRVRADIVQTQFWLTQLTKDWWHKICMCQFTKISCWSSLYFPYKPWIYISFQALNVFLSLLAWSMWLRVFFSEKYNFTNEQGI